MFQYFGEHHYSISNPYRGIYYIEGKVLFPTQVIVTRELDEGVHIWLGALSDRLKKQNMLKLLESVNKLSGKAEREFADSVLEVSIGANKQVFEELMGDENMCQALMEIMEPQLMLREDEGRKEGRIEGRKEGRKEGRREGIQGTVDTLREFGHGDLEIKKAIMHRFALSAEEAEEYL